VAVTGGDLHPVTDFDEPVGGAYLPTTDEIVMSSSTGGNERSQLSVIRDDGSGWRRLVDDPEHVHRLGGVRRDGSLLAYSSNARNDEDFDVYVLPLDGGDARPVFDGGGWCDGRGFSPDGKWLAVTRMGRRSGDTELVLVDVESRDTIDVSNSAEGMFGAPAWLADS